MECGLKGQRWGLAGLSFWEPRVGPYFYSFLVMETYMVEGVFDDRLHYDWERATRLASITYLR